MRIDVLGRPRDSEFSDLVFAFEVKNKNDWKIANFAKACKQASDYNYSYVDKGRFAGKIINAAFIYTPEGDCKFRDEESAPVFGARFLAGKYRVGTLTTKHEGSEFRQARMTFGHNEIWRDGVFIKNLALGALKGKRPVGGSTMQWPTIENKIQQHFK